MQSLASLIDRVKSRHDDDIIDRANYVYTAAMFGMFGLLTAAKQYVGEPLQCWIPPEFKGNWEKYTESYCFVENTYFVPMHEKIPRSMQDRERLELSYYQWVCFMMMAQMVMFILPKAVWNSLNLKTGLSINSLVSTSKLTVKKGQAAYLKDDPTGDIAKAKDYMQTLSRFNREKTEAQRYQKRMNRRLWNGYVTKLYLFYKFVNLCNAAVQLYVLNRFLGSNYTFWGWGLLTDLINGRQWQESGQFPRVTYCDVYNREMGDVVKTYTVQCVLMINMFNEKIYIFVWFWLLLLAGANLINLFQWLYMTTSMKKNVEFIKTQLAYRNKNLTVKMTEDFIKESLFLDAVTTLRLVQLNCGDLVSSELVGSLYDDYANSEKLSCSGDSEKMAIKHFAA